MDNSSDEEAESCAEEAEQRPKKETENPEKKMRRGGDEDWDGPTIRDLTEMDEIFMQTRWRRVSDNKTTTLRNCFVSGLVS